MDSSQRDFLASVAKALAAQFGQDCEVVVHDLESGDPENTIAAIENGHVSNRQVGGASSHIVLEAMKDGIVHEDQYSYLTKTSDGRLLRSSTIYLRDNSGKATGIFSINYDLTSLMMAQGAINGLIGSVSSEPEHIPTSVTELLDDLIDRSMKLVGKPVAMMTKEDKIKAIGFLNESGALLITKSGDRIAKHFGISKYTLYSYLDMSNNNSNDGKDGQ